MRMCWFSVIGAPVVINRTLFFVLIVMIGFTRCTPETDALTELPAEKLEVKPAAATTSVQSLTVMSWNIHGSAARSDPDHIEKVVETIRTLDPDVVMLQEVHRKTQAAGGIDQFEILARTLRMNGCFGESLEVGEHGSYGNAILTDGDIVSTRRFALPGRGEPRTMLECRGKWQNIEVPLLTTHLTAWDRANRRTRARQAQAIEMKLNEDASPLTILGGDFNASLTSPELAPIATGTFLRPAISRYVVTHPGTGRSYDHLLMGDAWTVDEGRVIRQGPSDHWPLLATVRLAEGDGS